MFGFKRFFNQLRPKKLHESLGLNSYSGGPHYRAFVGPPADYDLIAAMAFNLLTTLGLRQHHAVLDIGCGSLRIGRLLIPYLNAGNYTGIEPNKWLVNEGIQRETGRNQIRIKRPRFYFADSTNDLPAGDLYDYALAQSVFSHCGPDLIEHWLKGISSHLKGSGALAATFLTGSEDCQTKGWVYPGTVRYTIGTMETFARAAGLEFLALDWKHPRQSWALFAKPGFNSTWFQKRPLTWNTWLDFASTAGGAG